MVSHNPPPDDFDWQAREAEVLNLDDARTRRTGPADTGNTDTHFEVMLDEEPTPGGTPVDLPKAGPSGHQPIVPPHLSTWPNIKHSTRNALRITGYRVGSTP